MESEPKQKRLHLTPEEYAKQKQRLDYLMRVRHVEEANLREGDARNSRSEGESSIKKLERLLESAEIITKEEPGSKK